MNYPLHFFYVNTRFKQRAGNIAGKNKMTATMQREVLQNLDWDGDKFEQIIGGMYVEGNATASFQ